jgi:hypothetical protein
MRLLSGEGYHRKLWDTNVDQVLMAERVLDLLGTLLWPRAVQNRMVVGGNVQPLTMRGTHAFQFPLGANAHTPQCMLLDPARVRAAANVVRGEGYVWLVMGQLGHGRANRTPIREGAHRFVLWSSWGPPPDDIVFPVAMHSCHNKACLNPLHLVWGENAENTSPLADMHFQNRWHQQVLNNA